MTNINEFVDMKQKQSKFAAHHNGGGSFTSRSVDANYAASMTRECVLSIICFIYLKVLDFPSLDTITISDGIDSVDQLSIVYAKPKIVVDSTHL